ncbi:steroid 17alpha-monooxygenase or 17alpha-hydroxyprogesterone aldolase [Spatholobus suberectus]|nr:steroid 17alpha-monooxygenase or 17alpha-hydroxyprogesterone aldolase [Spatholobus suberectus]
MLLQLGQRQNPTVVVSSVDVAMEIMKTHDVAVAFSSRPQNTAAKILLYGCIDIAFGLYGESWSQKKKICVHELLTPKRAQSFHLIREEEVAKLVNKLREVSASDECRVNLKEMFMSTSNDIVCKSAFGRKYAGDGYSRVKELARNVMVQLAAFTVRDYFPLLGWVDALTGKIQEFKATLHALDSLFDQAIAEHLTVKTEADLSKKKDFVDILLQLQENNSMLNFELTKNDLKALLMVSQPCEPNSAIYLSVLCFLISVAFVVFKFTRRSKSNTPPSPPKLPFIGNLHQLGTLPHRSFQALSHKYGPLMLLQLGQVPTLVVSSADVAREIFKTHDAVFSNRPKATAAEVFLYGYKDVGFAPYGDEWKQKRKVCVLELVSMKSVRSFQFIRVEEVAEMIGVIREACASKKSSVNLSELLIALTNNIMSRCVLGQKYDTPDGSRSFGELGRKLLNQFTAFCVGDFFPSLGWVDVLTGQIPRFKATLRSLDIFFDHVIAEHKTKMKKRDDDQSGKKDFVDILLQLEETGMLGFELSQDNLKALLVRNPEFWDRPDEFLPHRFENSHVDFKGQDLEFIPFGAGRRGCPGITFGVTVAEYALANLLYWFDWKLPKTDAPVQGIDMSERYGITVNKKVPLLLEPIPYHARIVS